jgi:hypothetical protein
MALKAGSHSALHLAPQPRHGRPQPEVRRPGRRRARRRAGQRKRYSSCMPLAEEASAQPSASIRRWMKQGPRLVLPTINPSISPT